MNTLVDWILWILPDIEPNLALTAIGTAAAVIAIVQTFRANRLNKKVVEAQGALDAPHLSVSLLGDPTMTLFMVAAPIPAERVIEFPLWFLFKNDGRKTARDIEISITSSSDLYYGGSSAGIATIEITHEGSLKSVVAKSIARSKHLETQLFAIGALHPDQSIEVKGQIVLPKTSLLKSKVPVTFKDGKTAVVPYEVYFAYTFAVTISHADNAPIKREFSMGIINTLKQSPQEFLDERNRIARKNPKGEQGDNVLRQFPLIEVRQNDLVADEQLPIDRVNAKKLTAYLGVETADGLYWVPGLGVRGPTAATGPLKSYKMP